MKETEYFFLFLALVIWPRRGEKGEAEELGDLECGAKAQRWLKVSLRRVAVRGGRFLNLILNII